MKITPLIQYEQLLFEDGVCAIGEELPKPPHEILQLYITATLSFSNHRTWYTRG